MSRGLRTATTWTALALGGWLGCASAGLAQALVISPLPSDVVIGAEGRIAGSISAESIDLRGQMEGKMSCASLTLRSVSQVRADVNYHSLTIESGAQIDGKFTRAKG